jgi:hypothetical protein
LQGAYHPKMKNPAGFIGEQGSRKSMIYVSIELPACLLVDVFIYAMRLTAAVDAEPEAGPTKSPE